MDQSDLQQRVKADAHATLALYYATQAHHLVLEQPRQQNARSWGSKTTTRSAY
jgi:hypothetical protein